MSRLDSVLPVILGLVLLCCAGERAFAQESPADSTRTLDVSADASLGLQRLGGGSLASVGGRIWLELPAGWRVGFGAAWGLNHVDGGELEGSGLEATFGMGGASLATPLPDLFDLDGLEAVLTLGSGSVSLENALVGTTVDRETVWVVQPSILWHARRVGPFSAGVEVGYRLVLGSDGLSRLEPEDLRTFTIAAVLSFPPR
ncbi:MAG TPA: hypothetical protein VJ925_14415 [Longimicrobiales bacterium]|nr:hypothetical protein [Longimicrobiales bacterium]